MAFGSILCCCCRSQNEGNKPSTCCDRAPPLIQEGGMFQILVKEGERESSRSIPVKIFECPKKSRKTEFFIENDLEVPVTVTIEYISPEMDARTVIFSGVVEHTYHSAINRKGQITTVKNKIDYYFQVESTDAQPPSNTPSTSDPSITRSSMLFNLLCCGFHVTKTKEGEMSQRRLPLRKKKDPIEGGGCFEISVNQKMNSVVRIVPVITSMKQKISYYLVNATEEPISLHIKYTHPKTGRVVDVLNGTINDYYDSAINARGKVITSKKNGFDYIFVVEYEKTQELAIRIMKTSVQ